MDNLTPRDPAQAEETSSSPDLTNVHQALAAASVESRTEGPMKNFSVRLSNTLKASGQTICARHGTDLGSFLRHCLISLVRDYGGELPVSVADCDDAPTTSEDQG